MGQCLPSRSPLMVVALVIEIDCQVKRVGGRGDLELAMVPNVGPYDPKKHVDDVSVRETDVGLVVVRGQEKVQHCIGTAEQEILIGVGPDPTYFRFQIGVVVLPA